MLPPRAHGGDRFFRPRRSYARFLCAVHGAAIEPDTFILRRNKSTLQGKPTEAGIEVKLVSLAQLAELILAGEFVLQLHIGAVLLAGLHGYIDLGAFRTIRSGSGLPEL